MQIFDNSYSEGNYILFYLLKKDGGSPYYSQIEKLYICIDSKDKMNFYVRLVSAVPKCDDYDYCVSEEIEKTEKHMSISDEYV